MRGRGSDGWIEIGDAVPSGEIEIDLELQADVMEKDWDRSQVCAEEIHLVHNGTVVMRCPADRKHSVRLSLSAGWLRADLIGTYYGRQKQCLAFTNPIFME